jgi:hypothetical protein
VNEVPEIIVQCISRDEAALAIAQKVRFKITCVVWLHNLIIKLLSLNNFLNIRVILEFNWTFRQELDLYVSSLVVLHTKSIIPFSLWCMRGGSVSI